MSLYDLEVGDFVVVTHSSNRGDKAEQAVVVKKGRKLITVQPEGSVSEYTREVFRLEDGSYNSKDYPHHAHVYTIEEYAEKNLRASLDEELRKRGVKLDPLRSFDTDQMQRVLAIFKGEETQ